MPILVMSLFGVLLVLAGLVLMFARKGPKEEVILGEKHFSAPRPVVVVGVGLVLMAPYAYSQSFAPRTTSIFPEQGYGLCDLRPYSAPAQLGGPDDETLVVLRSLLRVPNSDETQLSHWGIQIAKLLKRDPEVLEAFQAAIVRSNYTSATLLEYCEARDKPTAELTAYEAKLLEKIHSEIGFSQ